MKGLPLPMQTGFNSAARPPISPFLIGDLPGFSYNVVDTTPVRDIAAQFNKYPNLPGVILTNNDQYSGLITRDHCFEMLGRPFGIELFQKLPCIQFATHTHINPLILEFDTPINEAVKIALTRCHNDLYDPIVVRRPNSNYSMVDMRTLLTAHADLLSKLYLEVQQLAVNDPLTNIKNRRGFFEVAQPQLEFSKSHREDLCALMIDIDNFKMVNDIYGHYVGDCVIRAVTEELQKNIRQTDLIGRIGGEEFVILLPGTCVDLAIKIADRIRMNIECLSIYVDGFQVSVTISIGISQFTDAIECLDNLLKRADEALYAAKWSGKNKTILWDAQLINKYGDIATRTNQDFSIQRQSLSNERIYDETIEGWARALELRDKETEGHAQRVANLTVELASRLGARGKTLVDVRRGALLHDIGKIAIPDSILFKPGPLDPDEWEIMQKHPVYAFELLSPIRYLQNAIDIPYCHHEHWDGSGYPRHLHGEEIPFSARIFTLIDIWDALSTDRCYRPAWKKSEIHAYLLHESGKTIDPLIVDPFLSLIQERETGSLSTVLGEKSCIS
jgi:diguanylate cyclase (GGDEF)-like protein/putative nucleotidyltransferase with HDIG domain